MSVVLGIGGSFVIGLVGTAVPSLSTPPTTTNRFLVGIIGYGLLGLSILVTFLIWWGYFVLCELLWNGQTIGKKRLHLRVVRAGGQSVGLIASLVRNLLRVIDLFLLIGVLVMLIDGSSRRLGDFAAGTLVIREPRPAGKSDLATTFGSVEIPPVPEDRVNALPNAGRLTAEHYAVLREFFARQIRLDHVTVQLLAQRLARELGQLLAVPPVELGDPTTFLATALRAYEARHRYDEATC